MPTQPMPGQSTSGQPTSGQPTSGQPTSGQPTSGQPTSGQPTSGQPTSGPAAYGPSPTGQAQFGQPGPGPVGPQYGAPQYGAPQYGAPQYGPPATGFQGIANRGKVIAILGGSALVVIILISVFGVRIFGGNGPDDAVEAYLDAAKKNDRAAALDQVCSSLRGLASLSSDSSLTNGGQLVDYDITRVHKAGRTAEVTAKLTETRNGRTVTSTTEFLVIKEGDDWRICGGQPTR